MKNKNAARWRLRFLPVVIGLIVLPLIGTAGYMLLEGMSLLDALYMTVITMSTVGFAEVKPLSPVGRLFTIGFIVSSVFLLAYALNIAAHYLFSGEWRKHWVEQKRNRMITKLSNHVIVCGYGRVGRHVVAELKSANIPFVIIDINAEKIRSLEEAGALCVLGDAAEEANLKQAGIERARGLIAAVKSDAENVFIVLTARSLRADIPIVARADQDESQAKLRRAGATQVILPYHITGRRMVDMLLERQGQP